MKRTVLIAMVLCTVFSIVATTCLAQVINGCVKSNGDLSIVSGPGQCKSNETPISWNVTGPEGPQGPQGPAGVANGIRAAVWGELIFDKDDVNRHCSVPFWRGADEVIGETLSGYEDTDTCYLTFTLPEGQPQSWGTAYSCLLSVESGTGADFDTTCQSSGGFTADPPHKPHVLIMCRNGANDYAGGPDQAYISFLCITQ
jgi:hypothetical protein